MLIALPPEHRSNFQRLRQFATWIEKNHVGHGHDRRRAHSYCLVRFYAAESGLKYLLSKSLQIPHQHEVSGEGEDRETVEGYGHDIHGMAKRLRAPATSGLGSLSKTFRLAGGYKTKGEWQSFRVARVHEAWRYGLAIRPDDQTEIETGLTAMVQWIEQQLA
jgi:hypothetical protein